MNKIPVWALAGILASTAPAMAQQQLSVATGGTGGVYFPIGGGIAELISNHLDGYSAVAEVTGASVENMAYIHSGDADFALAIADTLTQARTGTGAFEGRPVAVQTLVSVYAAPMQIVTLADSPIHSFGDLRGHRVSVGAPGSGNEVTSRAILNANGITYDDFASTQRLNYNETSDAMRDGILDAGIWASTAPTSSIMSLAATRDVRVIGLSDEEIATIKESDPAFVNYTLPAGLYPGMEEDLETVALSNALVVNADMDEELAYSVTRLILENAEYLQAIHPAANDMTVEFAVRGSPVPLHPGAVRYYEEIGVEIPEHLRP